MTLSMMSLILLLFLTQLSFAEEVFLTTNDGNFLVTDQGDRLVVEGKSYNLKAVVQAKSAEFKPDKSLKTGKIILPSKEVINIKKNSENQWIPSSVASMKLLNLWELRISVSKSLANAKVTLEGCGQSFTTDEKGNGEETFVIDAVEAHHMLNIRKIGGNELSKNLLIQSNKPINCSGYKKLKCN